MLDVSVAYNRYKFLGNEFLTWLWYVVENDRDQLKKGVKDPISLDVGNRIVLTNRINDAVETITIKGDDADLKEGLLALRKGAMVTEMNLALTTLGNEWRFSLKGESLAFSGFKTPETGQVETGDDVEGAVLEKAYLYEQVVQFTDHIFKEFLALRISNTWNGTVVPMIKKWVFAN